MKAYTFEEVKTIGNVEVNTLICGDCLQVAEYIPSGSIDAIITDIPYG